MIKQSLLAAVTAVTLMAEVARAAPVVQTRDGAVAGTADAGVLVYRGLPFAAPPVGALRWRAPQPVTPWQGIRDASHFAASCEQPRRAPAAVIPWTAEYLSDPPFSEDCLYLNVWTPSVHPLRPLPVLVWIYGGGFTEGSGEVPLYRGADLARHGIVVVTINYRLGVFGFLASPLLDAEQGSSGTYGLMDQVAALRWVRTNIASFGGNPIQVTIEGQSAGAISVHHLLAAPSAAGLFAQAIAESNSWSGDILIPKAKAEAIGQRVADLAGARTLAALRALPADRLIALQTSPQLGAHIRFFPVGDGVFIPPGTNERSNIPVLLGSNHDEASAFSPSWQIKTKSAYQQLLDNRFVPLSARFAMLYPAPDDRAVSATVRRLLADSATAGIIAWAEARGTNAAPAYGYRFTHPEPGPLAKKFGTFHSSEIPYVFGAMTLGNRPFSAQDRAISSVMQAYWLNFIRTGNPNGEGLVPWPTLSTGDFMLLGGRQMVTPLLSTAKREAFQDWLAHGGSIGLF